MMRYREKIVLFVGLLFISVNIFGQYRTTQQEYVLPKESRPVVGLKTNLLYWATTTPNLGVEFALSPKWTFEATAGANPWVFGDNTRFQHWLAMGEIRYWPCHSFEGHFFGLHGGFTKFKVGEIGFLPTIDDHTYKGYAGGGGLSYGYHFPLGRRWGLELTIGVGYAYIEYDKYKKCDDCSEYMGNKNRHYVGPTKAGVSIIYLLK